MASTGWTPCGQPDPGWQAAFQTGQFLLAVGRTFHRESSMKRCRRGSLGRAFVLLVAVRRRAWRSSRRGRAAAARIALREHPGRSCRRRPGYAKAESTFTKEVETSQGEVQKLQATLDSVGVRLRAAVGHAAARTQRAGQAEGARRASSRSWSSATQELQQRPRPAGARAAGADPEQGQQPSSTGSAPRATTR